MPRAGSYSFHGSGRCFRWDCRSVQERVLCVRLRRSFPHSSSPHPPIRCFSSRMLTAQELVGPSRGL